MTIDARHLNEFERLRRLSNLPITEIAKRTGIRYRRLYRFFRNGGGLSITEFDVLKAFLEAEIAPSPAANGASGLAATAAPQ